MGAFAGQLNSNEIFSSIYNMIIGQTVMAPDLADNYGLVDKFKVEGSIYGDTELYYDQDVLSSRSWLNDSEASNLLNIHRPAAPKCQEIVLDQFRQIDITVDDYLSKRAWSSEGVFSTFNGIILSMITATKRLYEVTLMNAYIGTTKGAANRATVEAPITTATTGLTGEEKARVEAQTIAQTLADLIVDMKDYSRDFNDYKYMRAYNEGDLMVIWNSKFVNKINKVDLPTIFHKDGLVDKFEQYVLPARYFGDVITSSNIASYSASTPTTKKPIDSDDSKYTPGTNHANGTLRSLVEKSVTVGGTVYHVFPGDEIPVGATVGASKNFVLGEVYFVTEDDVICKVVTPETYKMMSAFQVGTNFFNARSLTTNHYLTWGYSAPDRLLGQPLVTVFAD